MQFGGFPEPFQSQSKEIYRAWASNRLELLVRQDLREISNIMNIGQVELLASFIPDRVGSPLSVQSLAEDLDAAHTTVTRWMKDLSDVYYHFEIKPHSKSIPRALKKEGKVYLYDWSTVENDGPRFENMVASHLLKAIDFYNDTGQGNLRLRYLRDKEKNEVDFVILEKEKPLYTVEAKRGDLSLAKGFQAFRRYIDVPHFQIVKQPGIFRRFEIPKQTNAYVISFDSFFEYLP